MLSLRGFEINDELNLGGGQSRMFRGKRLRDKLPVIIKILDVPGPQDLRTARLELEFQQLQKLGLPGVLRAQNLEVREDSAALILENFNGQPLRQILDQGKKPWPATACAELALKVVETLIGIHKAGVTHMNLHPGSIFYDPQTGQTKLTDFSQSFTFPWQSIPVQHPGNLEGVLMYLSPEQTGRMNRLVDYRSDFYSLGVILYELLTGNPPFAGVSDPSQLVFCHLAQTPEFPAEAIAANSGQLRNIVAKLLAKSAEERYINALGIKADLQKCLSQKSFLLGVEDYPTAPIVQEKLYGRAEAVAELQQAFQQTRDGKISLFLVSGETGAGKSTLVKELYRSVTENDAYLASGKCDQFEPNVPYAAVMGALSHLTEQLLTEHPEKMNQWYEDILREIGPNGQILTDLIPTLKKLIGLQPKVDLLSPVNTLNRFNQVFVSFICLFATEKHPLILFLDDLQWVDSATIAFLQFLLKHPDINHLLIIGAYRKEEVTKEHPLLQAVEALQKEEVPVQQLQLNHLDADQIQQLVTDTLGYSRTSANPSKLESAKELANLITVTTQGNPLFIKQFITALCERKLLTCHQSEKGAFWQLERIQTADVARMVSELISNRLKALPEATQLTLQQAACMGFYFDEATLLYISGQQESLLKSALQPAIDAGLVIYCGLRLCTRSAPDKAEDFEGLTPEYHFAHNLVQLAAYQLLDDYDRSLQHLGIGQRFLADLPANDRAEHVFMLLKHLNGSRQSIVEASDNIVLTELNLIASKKAKNSVAYGIALDYAVMAFETLDESWWVTKYKLAQALFRERAELEYLHGNLESAEKFVSIAIQHAKNNFEKADLYTMKVVQLTAVAEYEKAIEAGNCGLSLLGLQLPKLRSKSFFANLLSKLYTRAGYDYSEFRCQLALRIQFLKSLYHLRGKSPESLQKAHSLTNPEKKICQRLLAETLVPAYFTNRDLWFLISTHIVNIGVIHGMSVECAPGFSAYGVLFNRRRKNFKQGYQFGQLSYRLTRRFNDRSEQCHACQLIASHLHPWVNHMLETEKILDSGYVAGLDSGELHYGSAILIDKISLCLYEGRAPAKIRTEIKRLEVFCRRSQIRTPIICRGFKLIVDELEGKAPKAESLPAKVLSSTLAKQGEDTSKTLADPKEKSIEEMKSQTDPFQDFIEACCDQQEFTALTLYLIFRALNLYLHGYYKDARIHLDEATPFLPSVSGTLGSFYYCALDSLVSAALYESAQTSRKVEIKKQMLENQKMLTLSAKNCPENFLHFALMAKGEITRTEGNLLAAIESYEQAANSARQHDFFAYEGLAFELATQASLRRGNAIMAAGYALQARLAYKRWTAVEKMRVFDLQYASLIEEQGFPIDAEPKASPLKSKQTEPVAEEMQHAELETITKREPEANPADQLESNMQLTSS